MRITQICLVRPKGQGNSYVLIGYASLLVVTATALASGLVLTGHSLGRLWATVCLAVVAAIAERSSVRLSNTTEVSISLVPTVFAAVLFGPLAAMLVGAASMLGDLQRGRTEYPHLKWATYTSTRALTAGAVGLVASSARSFAPSEIAGIALAATAGAFLAESLDVAFAALTRSIRRNGGVAPFVRAFAPLVGVAVALYSPVVALLVLAYEQVSPLTLPLFMIPSLAAQRLFGLYQEQRQLAQDVLRVNDRLERANLSFATALVATVEAKDQYTAGHSAAVAIYARDIAVRMGLSEDAQRLAHVCGLVHDVGKIGLPPGLLEKPGALTPDERRQMERHPEIGQRILTKVEDYSEIAAIVRHHHERVDGMGYPDRLDADEIPLISKIIAVADAYNAMTSDRPYRDAMPTEVARMRLAQAAGSQFDASVVAAFDDVLADATEIYRAGERPDFSLTTQIGPRSLAIAV